MQLRLEDAPGFATSRVPTVPARPEIVRLFAAGYGPSSIARSLNSRGIPTPSGRGRWWPETVRRHGDPVAAEQWRLYIARYRARRR